MNISVGFSRDFLGFLLTNLSKVVSFKRYCFVPTFGIQVSHFMHMAITIVLAWCMAALQGRTSMLLGMPASSIWSALYAISVLAKDQLAWHFLARRRHVRGAFCSLF